eukprot:c20618_g2_i1.p1 GENE.c20618_g2_i1~~c20618_g2_i1.p1  ORF type:complete len:455 (-),score=145.70 c20618_g2_i1:30-1394(-)
MSTLEPILNEIKPFKFDEKTIKKDMKLFAIKLIDTKNETWENRETIIRKIAGMALTHQMDDQVFAEILFQEISRSLADQVSDLRSQIVRVACAAVVILVQELCPYFDTTFEQFIFPVLLKQLQVKALPIKESANDCIQMAIAHHTNTKLLKPLYLALSEKDKIIRGRAAEYIAFICTNWDRAEVQKILAGLLNHLKPMCLDGSEIVRDYARQSIIVLSQSFPRAIEEFLPEIDPKVLKLLEVELPSDMVSRVQTKCQGSISLNVVAEPTARRSTGSTGAPKILPRSSGGASRLQYFAGSPIVQKSELRSDNDISSISNSMRIKPSSLGQARQPKVILRTTQDLTRSDDQQTQAQVSIQSRLQALKNSPRIHKVSNDPMSQILQAEALANLDDSTEGLEELEIEFEMEKGSFNRNENFVENKFNIQEYEKPQPSELLKKLQRLRNDVFSMYYESQ